MDHSAHMHVHDAASTMDMGHGGGGMAGHRCQMSMLFTWNTQDLCLVFRWWHVTSRATLLLSLLGVVLLSMGYEFLRLCARRYEARVDAREAVNAADDDDESSSLLPGRNYATGPGFGRRGHVGKGLFYGVQVFYSFFIMLLFMTYNGWVMISVAIGSFLGYVLWGGAGASKSVACH